MKYLYFYLFVLLSFISCKEKPTFCESTNKKVTKIKLIPDRYVDNGKQIIIKNDSLIQFITEQICDIKDVYWSTGNRGEGSRIEIELYPNSFGEKLVVVSNGGDYRIREGTTYFKNDVLCKTIFKLVETKSNEKVITVESPASQNQN